MLTKFINEIIALSKLALPVSLAQLAIVGMTATDVVIAGHAGTVELAGLNLGTNAWNMVIFFFLGIGFSTQPLIGNQFGARNAVGLKHQFHQSIWTCFFSGIVAMIMVWAVWWAMSLLTFEANMLAVARSFLLVISFCAIPMVLIPAVRGTLEGMSLTREVFAVNLAGFLINIPFDYVLVYGHYGFPKLGGVGCAWATATIVWLMLLANLFVISRHSKLRDRHLLKNIEGPNWATIISTLKLGVPIGISTTIELSMFAGAGMLIASFGIVQASAHAVAITIASISFMLYLGIGQGIIIRASQFLGAKQEQAAWYTVKAGISFNVALSSIVMLGFIVYAEQLVLLFSEDNEVIQVAVVLLYFGAAFQIADCLQLSALSGLRAYQDTTSAPKYQFIAFWILAMPLGIALAFYDIWPGLEQARGMWLAMLVGLALTGVLLLLVLKAVAGRSLSADTLASTNV